MLRNLIFTVILLLLSNKIFSQEMCQKNIEGIFGNPYDSSERDAHPMIQSVAFKTELKCLTSDEKIINFFDKKSSELISKYVSLSMPKDKNKKPRYCLKTYPFTSAEEYINNFEKYEDCQSKRFERLQFQHSNELRMLFFSLIKSD